MKVAFWTLGIFVIGLFGVVMVNLFGNITVTDQLNYTTMKNAVESSMRDAMDIAHYRVGFCLCTDVAKKNETLKDGTEKSYWDFTDDSQYELLDITFKDGEEKCTGSTKAYCEVLHGEYRIDKKVFTESLLRRFAEMINNNKDYEITIKDVIEYPPKVSVMISSKDTEFSPTEKDSGGYSIVNQIDAILEINNELVPPTPEPTPTPTPTATPVPPSEGCYVDTKGEYHWCSPVGSGCPKSAWTLTSIKKEKDCKKPETPGCYYDATNDKYHWCDSIKNSCPKAGWEVKSTITSKENCTNACYEKTNNPNKGERGWGNVVIDLAANGDKWQKTNPAVSKSKCMNCYRNKTNQYEVKWDYRSNIDATKWEYIKGINSSSDCSFACFENKKPAAAEKNQPYVWGMVSTYGSNTNYKKHSSVKKEDCVNACYKINNPSKTQKEQPYVWGFAGTYGSNKSYTKVKTINNKDDCYNYCFEKDGEWKWGLKSKYTTEKGWTIHPEKTTKASCDEKPHCWFKEYKEKDGEYTYMDPNKDYYVWTTESEILKKPDADEWSYEVDDKGNPKITKESKCNCASKYDVGWVEYDADYIENLDGCGNKPDGSKAQLHQVIFSEEAFAPNKSLKGDGKVYDWTTVSRNHPTLKNPKTGEPRIIYQCRQMYWACRPEGAPGSGDCLWRYYGSYTDPDDGTIKNVSGSGLGKCSDALHACETAIKSRCPDCTPNCKGSLPYSAHGKKSGNTYKNFELWCKSSGGYHYTTVCKDAPSSFDKCSCNSTS